MENSILKKLIIIIINFTSKGVVRISFLTCLSAKIHLIIVRIIIIIIIIIINFTSKGVVRISSLTYLSVKIHLIIVRIYVYV